MLLDLEQKKGDSAKLDGRLIVYAIVDIDPADLSAIKHPIATMVYNGLLVAQGNYRDQNSLRDFLKSEMDVSLEDDNLEDFVDKLGGIESALDPQKLKEKMEHFDDIEEFIPTPAKIVPFNSIEEIYNQEGDVFYTGTFKNLGNAILSVNSFPILYQARYREQQMDSVRNEIDLLISQVERVGSGEVVYSDPGVAVETKLNKEYLPAMLYSRNKKQDFGVAEKQFRSFLRGYPVPGDIEAVVALITDKGELTAKAYKLLELYVRKITLVCRSRFDEIPAIDNEIKGMQHIS
jgi:hypothetical protein